MRTHICICLDVCVYIYFYVATSVAHFGPSVLPASVRDAFDFSQPSAQIKEANCTVFRSAGGYCSMQAVTLSVMSTLLGFRTTYPHCSNS